MRKIRKCLAAVAALLSTTLLGAHSAFAQGCALCYNDASAASQQGIAALRHGILILAIPPMLIFAGLFAVLYSRRNAHHEAILPAAAPGSARAVSEIILHLD